MKRKGAKGAWKKYRPPASRDIRNIEPKFWSLGDASTERGVRIGILTKGDGDDIALAEELRKAPERKSARVGCCPVAARRFQIFFTGRALKVAKKIDGEAKAVTLFDREWEIPFGGKLFVPWRTRHQQLRRRLERALGKGTIAFGMAEIGADYDRQVWQPHYHLTVFNASDTKLTSLRSKHFRSEDPRLPAQLQVKALRTACWYAYISKLVTYRKIDAVATTGKRYKQRKRLKAREFRQHMQYLAANNPTSFVFQMNCSVSQRRKKLSTNKQGITSGSRSKPIQANGR